MAGEAGNPSGARVTIRQRQQQQATINWTSFINEDLRPAILADWNGQEPERLTSHLRGRREGSGGTGFCMCFYTSLNFYALYCCRQRHKQTGRQLVDVAVSVPVHWSSARFELEQAVPVARGPQLHIVHANSLTLAANLNPMKN